MRSIRGGQYELALAGLQDVAGRQRLQIGVPERILGELGDVPFQGGEHRIVQLELRCIRFSGHGIKTTSGHLFAQAASASEPVATTAGVRWGRLVFGLPTAIGP